MDFEKYVLKKLLENNNIFYKNINIVCNELNFNEYWNYTWYQEPLIYSFNKSGWIIKEYFQEIYQKIQSKKSVVLIWDSLWDHHMLDGLSFENSLKIWFLNHNEDENLQKYLERYDIVLTWDHDFSNWERMILKQY